MILLSSKTIEEFVFTDTYQSGQTGGGEHNETAASG